MFVLTVASMRGVAQGYRAATGVFAGDAILMSLAAMGAASVLYANPVLFMVLKYAGAAYLGYIGIGLLRAAWRHWRDPRQTGSDVKPGDPDLGGAMVLSSSHTDPRADQNARPRQRSHHMQRPFQRALLVSLINPKAIFFFLSFFVQFVDTRYAHPGLTFFLLGLIVQICSFLYLSALIFAGSRLAHLVRSHPRVSALASASVGGLFLAFGIRLAGASLKAA